MHWHNRDVHEGGSMTIADEFNSVLVHRAPYFAKDPNIVYVGDEAGPRTSVSHQSVLINPNSLNLNNSHHQ